MYEYRTYHFELDNRGHLHFGIDKKYDYDSMVSLEILAEKGWRLVEILKIQNDDLGYKRLVGTAIFEKVK